MRKARLSLTVLCFLAASLMAPLQAAPVERVTLITEGGSSVESVPRNPAISSAGSSVLFDSDSATLVSDDDNGVRDVFVWDGARGVIEMVSLDTDGSRFS